MRIAIAYDCLYPWTLGGGERQYRAFAEEFVAQGHEVSYLTRRQWDGPVPEVRGVEVVAVAGRAVLHDGSGARRPGPALGFAVRLFAHLLRNRRRYDAVLVSALPATNVPAVRGALLGSRTAVAADWLEVWTPQRWRDYSGPVLGRVAWALQRLAARLSPVATCHSALNAARLVDSGLRSTPLRSPGLVFPEDHGPAFLEPPRRPHVIYVGRHIEDKHVDALPAAIAAARRHLPGLTATIYGDGPCREDVRREVERLGLEDVVALPGFVERAEFDHALRTASVLVNPSGREGYGLVVVEAMAAGTPVVVVDGPDNASVELVDPGLNGAVARTTDAEDLAAAIVEVIERGAELRRSARAWYDEHARTGSVAVTARRILAAIEARVEAG
ncbi:glycosyltransferase family 4 protein [Nocardioides daeguensis]|uniref:Glycosyltransferase family 4 protein n=1 Tax=Nocardioides daeguensis TaxID=908359 RepID=A0ABP6UWA9_9ACTN|nr:glycosyltransferase [Nocardioides daeguensis]MBV6725773.1 glycosyltransferase [Nocardioides daeguensis]MCR1772712.1 glycosyltransferase [Nocardioides daeguensis]